MPTFIVTVHLEGGAVVSIKEDTLTVREIDEALRNELDAPNPHLRLHGTRSILDVRKERVVGWTIDQP